VQESLIRAGALDRLGPNRATLMAALPQALKMAEQDSRNRDAGMDDLFGFDSGELQPGRASYEEVPEWEEELRLAQETM